MLFPMLSVIAILSLESLTARKYSHINETAHISKECDYTFYQNHPCQIIYIQQLSFIFYLRNLCVQSLKTLFFLFLSFFFLFAFKLSFVTLERIKTDLIVRVFQSYHFPCLPPSPVYTVRWVQNEKWKALTRITYVNWCSMGFF